MHANTGKRLILRLACATWLAAALLGGGLCWAQPPGMDRRTPLQPWDPDWNPLELPTAAAQPAGGSDSAQSKAESQRKEAEARRRRAAEKEQEQEKEQARIAEEKEKARRAEEEKARAKEQTFAKIQTEAEKGSIVAQYNLGKMYMEGVVVTKDESKAVMWFQKAISSDSRYAGKYCRGYNLSKEEDEVCKSALLNLVTLFMEGSGNLTKNIDSAERLLRDADICNNEQYWALYKKLGEQGSVNAQNELGLAYAGYKHGCKDDSTQAIYWFSKNANRGGAIQQYNLGLVFYMEKQYKDAIFWFGRVIKNSYAGEDVLARAENNLGIMYYNAYGVDYNPGRARELFSSAYEKGSRAAEDNIRRLNKVNQETYSSPYFWPSGFITIN